MRLKEDPEPIERSVFLRLARAYRRAWRVDVCVTDAAGCLYRGRKPRGEYQGHADEERRAFAIREALRWGEPTLVACPGRRLIWAVPLMRNERVTGGLVASASEQRVFAGAMVLDIRKACEDLRLRAEQENLTNATLLRVHREAYSREQQRAYAIHESKRREHQEVRALYLREEPALFSAIRSGDFGAAREILNRILVAMHHCAGNRLDVIKSFFLELVVLMSHTAVEAGAQPEELLGANFTRMTELAGIVSEEDLAGWLRAALERLLTAIRRNRRRDADVRFHDVIAYMERHCGEPIGRDDAARVAHVSPSHFSHLLRRAAGVTFTDLLNRMRVDRAAEMLVHTDRPLSQIALECGFQDQSYFTKVFKRHRHISPLRYRQQQPPRAGEALPVGARS